MIPCSPRSRARHDPVLATIPCSRRFRAAIPAGCALRRDPMSFLVEVEHRFRAVQGLASPVRRLRGLPRIEAGDGIDVTVAVGVRFRDDQLTGRGWFLDTDAVAEELERCCAPLGEWPWTELFDF